MSYHMNVLIIRAGALGDTLMLLPAIVALKDSAEITLAARSPGLQLLRPLVACGSDFEGPGWHGLFGAEPNGLDSLQVPAAEHVVAFLNDPEGHLRRNLQARFTDACIHLFPAFPPDDEQIHAALHVARCLQGAGLNFDPAKSMARARERALIGQRDQLFGYGPLVLHPGSGSEAKNHPPDFWLEVIRAIRGTMPGRSVKLLLGPAEECRFALFSGNLRDTAVEVHMNPKSDRLVRILEEACAYVGQDSGVTHLAALLGTPTMALFRSSSVRRWHPLGPCVKVVQAQTASPDLVGDVLEWIASMTARADRPAKGPIKESKNS